MLKWQTNTFLYSFNFSIWKTSYLNMLFNKIYGHHILSPPWYNHICIFLGWNAKLLKCRLDQCSVLVKDMLKVSTSLLDISQHSPEDKKTQAMLWTARPLPCQPCVSICVHKQLKVEHFSNLRKVEDQYSLHHDNIWWVDDCELSRYSGIGLEIINWDFGWSALEDVLVKHYNY